MMSDFSNYMEDSVLGWIKGSDMPAAPAAVYVGLFSDDPGEDGVGTEVTATIRSTGRVPVTFGAITNGSMSNDSGVDFGIAEGAATISHVAIFDAASGGNMLASRAIAAPLAIGAGVQVSFPVDAITVSLA
jgi:hypothetical protein